MLSVLDTLVSFSNWSYIMVANFTLVGMVIKLPRFHCLGDINNEPTFCCIVHINRIHQLILSSAALN